MITDAVLKKRQQFRDNEGSLLKGEMFAVMDHAELWKLFFIHSVMTWLDLCAELARRFDDPRTKHVCQELKTKMCNLPDSNN